MNKTGCSIKNEWVRTDTIILSLLLLIAAVFRFWAYDTLGIAHFDEGGYAMSAMAVYEWRADWLYPLQHLLSPALFFTLSGLVMSLLGAPADVALFMVSSVAGTLTVGIIYSIGRNIYGREAGVAAALLVALADYHIGFSRAGLTDVTFCFLFLLALVAYIRAERVESFFWAIIAGILTGLAWNTKYHGWLAGVVAGAALLPYLLQHDWTRFRAGFARVFTAAVVATLMYVPWFLYINAQEGGYAYMAEYQSGFLEPSNFLRNIISHAYAQYYLDGWSGMLAPLMGTIAVAILYRRLNATIFMLGVAMLLGGLVLGESIVVMVLALVGLVALMQDSPGYERSVLISFFLVFSLLSPFYFPYTRLLLPLMCAAYILAGIGLVGLVKNGVPLVRLCPPRYQLLSMVALSLALAFPIISTGMSIRGHTYLPSTGFLTAVEEIVPLIPENNDVAVIGEPAAVFYLRSLGYDAVHLDKLDDMHGYYEPGMHVYIVCGRYACYRQEDWFARYPGAFTRLGTGTVSEISEIRLFDDESPWSAVHWNPAERRDYDLQLFRLDVPLRPVGKDPDNRT